MSKLTTRDHATPRLARCRRISLLVAGVLALLASFALTPAAQAGYYEGYGYHPCSYGCGYGYRRPPCGYWRRCYSGSRPGLVYERRYVEREFVERRYAWPPHHYYYRRHYGYYPYGTYRSWSRPFPWGYGGVRGWRAPYRYGYEPSAERYYEPSAERYYDEEPPRPPAPVWDRPDY